MEVVDCTPRPTPLIESMRNVGYTMETAVADIIDNSIAAQASEVQIFHICENENPRLAILDNGHGMTRDELIEAMRPGGLGPLQERHPNDLGRFGLGLKTASFSQCRRLTVVTKTLEAEPIAACWDLDTMEDCWRLRLFYNEDACAVPWADTLREKTGTLILWEQMDKICSISASASNIRDDFLKQIELVRNHLSLVFHRYLEDKKNCSFTIHINNEQIKPVDPYFRGYPATQILAEEFIPIRGTKVSVKPFIIPHYSKLKATDYDALKELGGPAATQGFYVYRNRRLLAWGDWFRLRRTKTEASGLARVMVDIPNDLDDLWSLDIKKSNVSPPEVVKRELLRIIDRITDCSVRTYTSRGQRFSEKKYSPWEWNSSNKGVFYHINRNYPIIEAFSDKLSDSERNEFVTLLDIIEKFLPVEAIYNNKLGGNIDYTKMNTAVETEKCEAVADLLRNHGLSESEINSIIQSITK